MQRAMDVQLHYVVDHPKGELEIGHIGMRNVHPKGSMSFALKLGQNWQE